MIKIDLKIDQGVPQYGCSSCYNCKSEFGKSLCEIKNRGCCSYFPKFNLYDIHKMVKEEEGIETLTRILSLPKVEIKNYYIHAKGFFDEEGYKNYNNSGKLSKFKVRDKTIFFRACPFVKSGEGCTIKPKYRSYVCNFFICEEVVNQVKDDERFKRYEAERDRYVKWITWENNSLEYYFASEKLNLINNFQEIIDILKEMPLREYEYEPLEAIEIDEN